MAIKKCTCVHPQQDELHGKGNRVYNELKGDGKAENLKHRCTVCGNLGVKFTGA